MYINIIKFFNEKGYPASHPGIGWDRLQPPFNPDTDKKKMDGWLIFDNSVHTEANIPTHQQTKTWVTWVPFRVKCEKLTHGRHSR